MIKIRVVILGVRSNIDPQFLNHSARDLAVWRRTFDRVRSAETQAESIAHAKLVTLGVSTEVVVIVKDKNASALARTFAIEMRGRESANSAAHHDEIESLAGILRRSGCIPERAVA